MGGVASELGGTSVQTADEQSGVTYTAEDAEEPVQARAGERDAKQLGTVDDETEPGTEAASADSASDAGAVSTAEGDAGAEASGGTESEPDPEPTSSESVNPEPTQGDGPTSGAEPQDATAAGEPSEDGQTTAAEDAVTIDGAEVLSDDGDGTGKVLLADAVDGRDYSGQVTKTIGGTTYILIGNEQQLRAIGSDKPVIGGPVYRIAQKYHAFEGWKDEEGASPELLYPGDADLDANTGLRGEDIDNDNGHSGDWAEVGNDYYKYCTIGDGGERDYDVKNNAAVNTGLTYSADANYIIFRDIDLSQKVAGDPDDGLWTPLMFSGTMIGAVADPGGSIWNEDDLAIAATTNPVISHVNIEQMGKINQSKQLGVGFFATLTPGSSLTGDSVTSDGQTKVSSITLRDVTVDNQADGVENSVSLVGGLLSGVGYLLAGLYDTLCVILFFLPLPDLTEFLSGLLNIYATDPSTFATGAFAGSIVGDVAVDDCIVEQAKVTSVNGSTGGFVGYASGDTEYSFLGKVAGALVDFLSELLNVIPFLGLGDLITVLLDNNIIKANELLPTDYISPVITNSIVKELNTDGTALGSDQQNAAGGFVGTQIGTIVRDSKVVNTANTLTVRAKEYAGGFAGVMHDGQIKGLLENLGVDLGIDKAMGLKPQSLTEGSSVSAPKLTVTAANRAGGFAGAMAASYAVNSSVATTAALDVSATESYAGGFAGQMTMGWATNLGVGDGAEDLLGGLSSLITNILKSGDDSGQLLTLAGFEPSAALGCGVSGGSVAVDAKGSYAGGFTGAGEGAVIAKSDVDHVKALTHWQNGGALAGTTVEARNVKISGLESVSAKSLAGGVSGEMETAAVGGLLNDTVGIGSLKDLAGGEFTAFEVSDAAVAGVDGGFTVAVTDYNAGGAIGLATGGEVSNVKVDNLQSVTGTGEVGGFIGQAAAGSTLGADSINLLGLVKFSGLLTVAQTTHLDVSGSNVNGIGAGFTVTSSGKKDAAETDRFTAGGFYGRASSMTTTDSHVTKLKSVTAPNTNGMAGGFVGLSTTGGLAQVASDEDESSGILKQLIDGGLLSVDNLVGAVPYMIPKYKVTDVAYVDDGSVTADIAGGYAGSFESGEVNKFAEDEVELASKVEASPWAVKNISAVDGQSCAGGFGGRVVSGSLAEAGGGLDLLGGFASVNIGQLLSLVSAYMPVIDRAGVSADADPYTASVSTTDGFTVSATKAHEGIAGGYIGYGSGVQVSASNVKYLKHTEVTEPKDLEGRDGSDYFDADQSAYAVTGTRYAGGYIGEMNIGSTASAGESLSLLGSTIQLNDVLRVLDAVASTIKDSDVEGQAGGFAVLASDTTKAEDPLGDAGGFAGVVRGSRIENSDAHNFSHIIGQVSAGGYAGQAVPGDVADILGDDTSILDGLVDTDGTLVSLLQHFVPTIVNSETTSIPCGGAVRAQAESDAKTLRGLAGGYIGHNVGGQIKGNVTGDGHSPKEAAAIRIRSVYGAEYAGGFTGLMEAGSTASTGSLGLLWGLVNVNNLLSVLKVAYPTEENTAVYGPLAKLDMNTWNAWVDAVGANGGYGAELAGAGKVDDQAELDGKLADFVYGTNVVAGREDAEAGAANVMPGGAAGGYVGAMVTGAVTNGHAHDVRLVRGMHAAGGFAGMAEAGGAAQLGSVDILGFDLNLGQMLDVAPAFVPVIKSSSVDGYRTGMTVASPGLGSHDKDTKNDTGNAGGYIGLGSGVQIWGDGTDHADAQCTVSGLRRVRGSAYAGGFAGRLTAGTVASVDTDGASSGFLQRVIDAVLKGNGTQSLVQVLKDTMSTVRGASVTPADEAWGFTVEGPASGDVKHPIAAGGFAGAIEATVLGKRNLDSTSTSALTVTGLRGVDGGLYAGGFVGVATAGGAAQVNASTGEGASTTILGGLFKLGNIDAIQAFQPFIYGGSVTGVADGLQVRANKWDTGGLMHSQRMSGNAGGFAGTVMSGEVLNSKVANLNSVTGINYTGGFVGYTGKSGIADVEDLEALKLIGLTASVGDLIGTTVTNCSVAGVPAGYTVASQGPAGENSVNGDEPGKAEGGQKAGGFVGYADLAHITGGTATNLKRVGSAEAAGGFAGETSHAYLVSAAADSAVLGALNTVVNKLVKALYLDKAEREDIIEVNLGDDLLELDILSEGKVLSVTLLGLKISASLSEKTGDGGTDVVNVTIGDSTITLPCNENGLTDDADLKVNLIKGNSAHITDSTVTGIADGYDVFGGGATQDKNGAGDACYAGGFVGHNDEGVLTGDKMVYADVIRGTKDKTGPFAGVTDYSSNWWFNSVDDVEHDNTYHVYRSVELEGVPVSGAKNMTVSLGAYDTGVPGSDDPATAGNAAWARFDVTDHKPVANASNLDDWKGAKAGGADLGVYMEDGAKAVLMDDTAVSDNTGGLTPEPGDGQDPCEASVDLTLQKVWNDGILGALTRPKQIEVCIMATYGNFVQYVGLNASGSYELVAVEEGGTPPTITLSADKDGSLWSETWRKVIEDLPVAIQGEDGTLQYVTYTVEELTVDGYVATIVSDATEKVITITNTKRGLLPGTGGTGTTLIVAIGLTTLVLGGIWLDQQRRRRNQPRAYVGAHFANAAPHRRRASK